MHQSGIEINVKLALHWSLNWYSPSFGLCLSPVCCRNDRSCSGDRGIPEKVMAPNCKKHSLGCWSALYMNVSKGTGSIGTCQNSVFIVLLPCHVKKNLWLWSLLYQMLLRTACQPEKKSLVFPVATCQCNKEPKHVRINNNTVQLCFSFHCLFMEMWAELFFFFTPLFSLSHTVTTLLIEFYCDDGTQKGST